MLESDSPYQSQEFCTGQDFFQSCPVFGSHLIIHSEIPSVAEEKLLPQHDAVTTTVTMVRSGCFLLLSILHVGP